MRNSSTMPLDSLKPASGFALALLIASAIATSPGCQVFAPSAIGSLTTSREEKKVLKQAEADPFPSPADVGLKGPEDER